MYKPGGFEDDYDSFDYIDDEFDDFDMPRNFSNGTVGHQQTKEQVLKSALYNAVDIGDMTSLIQLKEENPQLKFDNVVMHETTLLKHAALRAKPDVVKYLLESGCDVNLSYGGETPLLSACSSIEDPESVAQTVQYLLDYGAAINVSDQMGNTPLIHACRNGYLNVVNKLIKDAYLEACDNQTGSTPIFHAIENNHVDVVKLLIEKGASIETPNRRGCLPIYMAKLNKLDDIVALFPPEEEKYIIPSEYLSIFHYMELVPGFKADSDVPPYFSSINKLLAGMEAEYLLEFFAKAKTSLEKFLTLAKVNMNDIGIKMPFHQNRVLLGLLKFHNHQWSKNSLPLYVAYDNLNSTLDLFDLYIALAGHLKHITVLKSTLKFMNLSFTPTQRQLQHYLIQNTIRSFKLYQEQIKMIKLICLKLKSSQFILSVKQQSTTR